MKKSLFLLLMFSPIKIFCQASYMNEAAEDARNSSSSGVLGNILFYLTFGLIGFIIIVFAISWLINFVKKNINGEDTPSQNTITPTNITNQKAFYKGWAVVKVDGRKFTYINRSGKYMTTKCLTNSNYTNIMFFDSAEDFINETAIVKREGNDALINTDGIIVFPFDNEVKNKAEIYDNIGGGCLTYLKQININQGNFTHEYYIIKRDGTLLYHESLKKIKPYKAGFFEISKGIDDKTRIDSDGKLELPFHTKSIKISENKYQLLNNQGYIGVFDSLKYEMIVPFDKYGALLYLESKDLYLCRRHKYNSDPFIHDVLDGKGEFQFTLQYDSVEILNDGFFLIYETEFKDNCRNFIKKGICTLDGKEIIPPIHDDIFPDFFQKGFLVCDNDAIDYLNFEKKNYAIVDLNGRYENLDYSHITIISKRQFKHDGSLKKISDLSPYTNNNEPFIKLSIQSPAWLECLKDDKYGIITLKNEVIVPFEYGLIVSQYNGVTKELEIFEAHIGRNYVKYRPNGKTDGETRDFVKDNLIKEELSMFFPGMQDPDDFYILDRDDVNDNIHDDEDY